MTAVALYAVTVLSGAAGLLGHPPVVGRIAWGVWGWMAARRGLYARVSAERASQTPESQPAHKRLSVPSWARTDHHDYDEAA